MTSETSNQDVHEISSDEEEFAQWVQCLSCQKWRDILESECIYQVNGMSWTCCERDTWSCEVPESKNKWWNSKCTYQEYQPGDLLAVKIDG